MYQRVLVLLDGSAQAERAIPLAARIVRATGGTLIFAEVVFSPVTACTCSDETGLALAEDYLAYHISATYAAELAGIPIERSIMIRTEVGTETSVVFATALLEQADLLVISSCDEGRLQHQSFDAVTQEAIHHSPVPVLIVPAHGVDLPDPLDGSPLRVLVPLDGSPEAEMALEPAAQLITLLAAPVSAVLQVVYIVQKISAKSSNIDTFIQEEEMRRKATTYLKSLERRLASLVKVNNHLFVTSSIVLNSSVAQTILEAGETCSMFAIASRKRDNIPHVSMRCVIDQALQHIKLPTLIIRPHLSEIQVQPILPKEVLLFTDDCEDDDSERFTWSLPGRNSESSLHLYM